MSARARAHSVVRVRSDALLASNEASELNVVACKALITGFVENQ